MAPLGSAKAPLNTNAASDSAKDEKPSLATDGQGNWVCAWSSAGAAGFGSDQDIMVAHSTNNGTTWSAPAPLNTNAAGDVGSDGSPRLLTDGQGRWISTWLTTNYGGDWDIAYAISTDLGVTWNPPTPVNTNAYSDSPSIDDGSNSIAFDTDKKGRWITAWSSNNTLGGTIGPNYNIFYAIADFPSPIFMLSKPNGSEVLEGGTDIQIDWSASPALDGSSLRFELWNGQSKVADFGSQWVQAENHPATIYLPLMPEGSNYKIRAISVSYPMIWDESDRPFTIMGTPIAVRQPNGGEVWTPRSRQYIHWETNKRIAGTSVHLELWGEGKKVADLGDSWNENGNLNAAIWVSDVPTGYRYKIRAISVWNPSYWDESDQYFMILNRSAVDAEAWPLFQ